MRRKQKNRPKLNRQNLVIVSPGKNLANNTFSEQLTVSMSAKCAGRSRKSRPAVNNLKYFISTTATIFNQTTRMAKEVLHHLSLP